MSPIKILGISLPVLMAAGIWASANSDLLLASMGTPVDPVTVAPPAPPTSPVEPAAFDAPPPAADETSWPAAELTDTITSVAEHDLNLDAMKVGYREELASVHPRLRPHAERFVDLIEAGILPPHRISYPDDERMADGLSHVEPWTFPSTTEELFRDPAECDQGKSAGDSAGVIGLRGGATIGCPRGDNWFLLGNGADVINDARGDDVVIPNGGDDRIELGEGTDVVLLEKDWGHDLVEKSCAHAMIASEEAERIGWPHRFVNFVVIGQGLMPEDFLWETPTKLVHAPSGDSLELPSNCFDLIFTEPGAMPRPS